MHLLQPSGEEGTFGAVDAFRTFVDRRRNPFEDGEEELLDRPEVIVDKGLIDARLVGYLARGDVRHTLGDEEGLGGIKQCLAVASPASAKLL